MVEKELDNFATSLKDLGSTVETATSYAKRHIDTSFFDTGLFLLGAAPTVDQVRTSIERVLAKLGEITSASASAVRETAATYRAADDETDRRIRAAGNAFPAPVHDERPGR